MRGTRLAFVLAMGLYVAPARAADVHVGINIGVPVPPPIVVQTPPPLVVVPGSPVFYAPSVPYNYFSYGGLYWTFHEGHWFSAADNGGPWTYVAVERVPRPIRIVPVRYYNVPPRHWKRKGPPPWAGRGRGHEHGHGRGNGHHKHER